MKGFTERFIYKIAATARFYSMTAVTTRIRLARHLDSQYSVAPSKSSKNFWNKARGGFFFVLLTVHLSTILEINQLNAQIIVL